jgi:hypothetical protein
MAFDRALPSFLTRVTKGGVPIVSVAFASILAGIGVILSQTTVIFVQFNFVLYACIMMIPPALAAVLFPWLRREEYGRAPKLVNFKIGSIPGITLIGIITFGYLIWMIISSWLYPAVGGAIGPWTVGWYVLFAGVGLAEFLANMTPWKCPRDVEDEVLEARLERVMTNIKNPNTTILVLHAPPYGTNIDLAPALDKDLRYVTKGGQLIFEHVGSKGIRKIIEKYQPLLGLHGHIHESKGYDKIGRTLVINPGSEYNEGILH